MTKARLEKVLNWCLVLIVLAVLAVKLYPPIQLVAALMGILATLIAVIVTLISLKD